MRTKALMLLMGTCAIAIAAWLVQASKPVQADDIPQKYHETLRKGLEFLVKHQSPDGHWEGDGGKHPVAMTGLAGLALLTETSHRHGGGFAQTKHLVNIRKAADWLMKQCQPRRDGLIFSGHPSETARYMEGHGLATLFLAGAHQAGDYANEAVVEQLLGVRRPQPARQEKLTDMLTRAVKYIARAQSSRGGWYHTSKAEGHDFDDVSATAIQIQALQAAHNAGIAVSEEMINDALKYLETAVTDSSRSADTAAALACRVTPISVTRRGLIELEKTGIIELEKTEDKWR